MHRRQLFQYVAYAALALCLVGFITAVRKLQTAQALMAEAQPELARAKQELQRLQQLRADEQNRRASQPALSDAEVLELARLRAEVTRLRSALPPTLSTPPLATKASPAQPPPALKITTHSSAATANLFLGHTHALGIWPSTVPGKQLAAFLTPELIAAADGTASDSVMVTMRIMEFARAASGQLGIEQMQTGAALTPEQYQTFLKRAEQAEGTDILSMPRVITLSGREARVEVRSQLPDGTVTGPAINLTPTLDATRTAVRLDYKFELNQPAPSAPGK